MHRKQVVARSPLTKTIFCKRCLEAGYPSGFKASYSRSAGRITGISVQAPGRNKPVQPFVTDLSHTALGQPKVWTWSNGDAANRTFDTDGRMTGNEFASYIYDAASRITGITQHLWASSTATGTVTTYTTPLSWTVGYDSRNRLTSFNRAGAQTAYTYDANSNRLTAIDKTTSDTDLDGDFDNADFSKTTSQNLTIEGTSNRLLGFTQTLTNVRGTRTVSTANTNVSYAVDAAGNLTSDGLRSFEYDAANRMSKARIFKDGEEASIRYLHNATGQRVFKGEPTASQTLPSETDLGTSFIDWLRKNFKWLYANAQANTSIGTAYVYGDGEIPSWALLGEYDNGSAKGAGRSEFIWLPTEDGNAVPVGMFRNGKLFAIHSDHLGTPRLMTNELNQPVWQWPYSAFGNNKPTGILKAAPNPKAALTNVPVLLKATAATEMGLRMPGQVDDPETGTFYNAARQYWGLHGSFTQFDPTGLHGGPNRRLYGDGDALNKLDPEGLQAQGAAAICCPAWILCACAITAATWGVYSSEAKGPPGQSTAMHDTDNRRQRQYEAAKSRCTPPNPEPDASCSELSKMIDMLQNSVDRYKYFDATYSPGRHSQKVSEIEERIKNLKDRYKKDCSDCK